MATRVKNLEKVTKELLGQLSAWEETNGQPFMFGGARYADRVLQQDEHYLEVRDGLRNARKKKDGKNELPAPPSAKTAVVGKRTSVAVAGAATAHNVAPATALKSSKQMYESTPMRPGGAAHPPVPPTRAAAGARMPAPAVEDNNENLEPVNVNRISTVSNSSYTSNSSDRDSNGTQYTSLTEIKERPLSTDSHTVIKNTAKLTVGGTAAPANQQTMY